MTNVGKNYFTNDILGLHIKEDVAHNIVSCAICFVCVSYFINLLKIRISPEVIFSFHSDKKILIVNGKLTDVDPCQN